MNELDDLLSSAIKERIKASPDAPGLDFVERRSAARRRSRRIGLAAASVVLIAGGVFAASVWDGAKTRNVDTAAGEVLEAETEAGEGPMATDTTEPDEQEPAKQAPPATECGEARIVQLDDLSNEEEVLLAELLVLEDSEWLREYGWQVSDRGKEALDLVAMRRGSSELVAYARFKRSQGIWKAESAGDCVELAVAPTTAAGELFEVSPVIYGSEPDPGSSTFEVWVIEGRCGLDNPEVKTTVDETQDSVSVLAHVETAGACFGILGTWRPYLIELAAPFGDRQLVDASFVPGLVRTWPVQDEALKQASPPSSEG